MEAVDFNQIGLEKAKVLLLKSFVIWISDLFLYSLDSKACNSLLNCVLGTAI